MSLPNQTVLVSNMMKELANLMLVIDITERKRSISNFEDGLLLNIRDEQSTFSIYTLSISDSEEPEMLLGPGIRRLPLGALGYSDPRFKKEPLYQINSLKLPIGRQVHQPKVVRAVSSAGGAEFGGLRTQLHHNHNHNNQMK